MIVHYPKASILDSDAHCLVVPVNSIPGVMGRGLASAFAARWPVLRRHHASACNGGILGPGLVAMANVDSRWFALAATKDHWANPSTPAWVADILVSLNKIAFDKSFPISSISIPALGCGLGGLFWNDVKYIIQKELTSDFDWRIYPPRK